MSDINEPKYNLRVAVKRDDLVQFVYLVRSDMAQIIRQLDDIVRRLELMGARWSERFTPAAETADMRVNARGQNLQQPLHRSAIRASGASISVLGKVAFSDRSPLAKATPPSFP
jgi:hypothetical protein